MMNQLEVEAFSTPAKLPSMIKSDNSLRIHRGRIRLHGFSECCSNIYLLSKFPQPFFLFSESFLCVGRVQNIRRHLFMETLSELSQLFPVLNIMNTRYNSHDVYTYAILCKFRNFHGSCSLTSKLCMNCLNCSLFGAHGHLT